MVSTNGGWDSLCKRLQAYIGTPQEAAQRRPLTVQSLSHFTPNSVDREAPMVTGINETAFSNGEELAHRHWFVGHAAALGAFASNG